MNRQLKAKWLKALRGGAYRQGQSSLCVTGGTRFCCLGVLADVQGFRWRDGPEDGDGLVPVYPKSGRAVVASSCDMLPARVAGGLSIECQEALAHMNDGGSNFKKIADYIEENL